MRTSLPDPVLDQPAELAESVAARRKLQAYTETALCRLRMQEAVAALQTVLTVSLWALAGLLFADRYFSLAGVGINVWVVWGALTSLGLPFLAHRVFSRRLHQRLAAILADSRLGLHSRLSSALTLDCSNPREAGMRAAFFAEASQKLAALNVKTAFPIRVPRSAVLLIIPILLAAGIYTLMPYQDALGLVAAKEKKLRAEQARAKSADAIQGSIEDLKRKIEEAPHEKTPSQKVENLLKKAEAIAKDMKEGEKPAEKSVVELGDLKKQIEKEKENLANKDDFFERLKNLQDKDLNLDKGDMTQGMSQALKDKDPSKAAAEARRLSRDLRQKILDNPNKSPEQKKQDLDKLKRELEKLQGALSKDKALRDELDKLAQQIQEASEQQEASDKNKDGKSKEQKEKLYDDINRSLDQLASELERLEEDNDVLLDDGEAQEMEQFEAIEESLEEAMEEMTQDGQPGENGQSGQGGKRVRLKKGQNGNKAGVRKGQSMSSRASKDRKSGQGDSSGQGQGKGDPSGQPGPGSTAGGPGSGRRPEGTSNPDFESKKVKGQLRDGAINGLSHFRGDGAKGSAPSEFKEALSSAQQEAASSLELERIPADAREVVKDYFLRVKKDAGIQDAKSK